MMENIKEMINTAMGGQFASNASGSSRNSRSTEGRSFSLDINLQIDGIQRQDSGMSDGALANDNGGSTSCN